MTEPNDRGLRDDTANPPPLAATAPNDPAPHARMKYYALKKNWRRIRPNLTDKKLNDILIRDFNKFTCGRWGKKFVHGDLPSDFETCDWDLHHRGRRPAYWQYVKHSARHWLVNINLRLAML